MVTKPRESFPEPSGTTLGHSIKLVLIAVNLGMFECHIDYYYYSCT